MNTYRVLIVDDEGPSRNKLKRQLKAIEKVELIGEAYDGPMAVKMIEDLSPDVVLLDIQMPGMSGFDVLRLLEEPLPNIIFVTAYDEYATKAFDVSAVDYLMKPVSDERLASAFNKIQTSTENIGKLLEQLSQENYAKRLAVKFLKRVRLVNVADIDYITSEHRVVYIINRQGDKNWTNETLEQLSRRLNPNNFFRIHRSSIINLSASFEIEPWDDGRLKIHFKDGKTLIVAREPAIELRKSLQF